MNPRSLAAAGALLAAAAALPAQSFTYPDFANIAPFALLGNAAQSGNAVRLTAVVANQTGWLWHRAPMPVANGFDTTFTFRITPPPSGTKAEGMAFVLHDDPNGIATQGGTVWGMGYGSGANGAVGIRNCVAVELDTFQDGFLGDTSANELTIHTRGAQGCHEHEQWSVGRTTPAVNLSNGQVHTLRVRYVPGTLEVFVDNAASPAISVAYSLATGGTYLSGGSAPPPALANGTAVLGFCATTGATNLWETVEILSWQFTGTPFTDPCYAGTFGQDVLRIAGSAGGFSRTVQLFTHQPFAIDIAVPPGSTGPLPYALLITPAATPGAPGTALPIGNACMPLAPLGPLVFVLGDTFGFATPVLPFGPAPFTLQLPPGVVTAPLSLVMQGVLAANNPVSIGLTNAIDVRFVAAPPPVVTQVVPLSGAPGLPITVTGTNFVPGVVVEVNGAPVVPTAVASTQIVFPYPGPLPCDSQLTVRNPDGQQASAALNPTPAVSGTVLGTGPAAGGAVFVVQGSGFAAGTTVTIGGAAATVLVASATVVSVRTPPGAPGLAQVVLTTPGGCQAFTSYTYQ
jgi:hypothetical protein